MNATLERLHALVRSMKRTNQLLRKIFMSYPIELKVKVKSLAAEAKIIRLEEYRAKTPEARASLHNHRVGVVRSATRHTLLAYGYLRGRSYRQLEVSCKRPPDWSVVEKMVQKYGPPSHNTGFEEWQKICTTKTAA